MLISGYSRLGNIWIGSDVIPTTPRTNSKTAAASNAAGLSADTRINDIIGSRGKLTRYLIYRCALDQFGLENVGVLR